MIEEKRRSNSDESDVVESPVRRPIRSCNVTLATHMNKESGVFLSVSDARRKDE